MHTSKVSKATKAWAEQLPQLAEWCRKAQKCGTVYYLIESVSRSGMSRKITLWTVDQDTGKADNAWCDRNGTDNAKAARRVNWSTRHRCFKVGGCGMDMVFALLYDLWPTMGLGDFNQSGVRWESLSRAE